LPSTSIFFLNKETELDTNNKNIIITAFVVLLLGCNTEQAPLTKEQLRLIDQLARKQTDSIGRSMDSACIKLIDNQYIALSDSLLKVRLAEIKAKMEAQ
jgi:hypothetical protein